MSRCYICNSPYHYSNRCTKRTQLKSTIECYKCRKLGHYSDKCPNESIIVNNEFIVERSIEGIITFTEMWGKNSVKIDKDCILAKIKQGIIENFLEIGIVKSEDIDMWNLIPHININGDQTIYDLLNGSKITLRSSSILIKKDSLEIKIGDNLHFTVLYKRDIGVKNDEVRQYINKMFLTFLHVEEPLNSDW